MAERGRRQGPPTAAGLRGPVPGPRRAASLAALAFVLAPGCLFPGRSRAELLPLQPYSTQNGLPHDRVKRIREDRLGFLWFCTTEGLCRFDGRHFTTYGVADGLPVPSVNDLLETARGFWVATNGGGVAFFDPEATAAPRFRAVPVGEDGGPG